MDLQPNKNIKPSTSGSSVNANVDTAQVTKLDDIVSITWENLHYIKPEWLKDEHILYELKLFVLDVSDSNDAADAGRCFTILHDLLRKAPNLAREHPDIFREYLRLLAVLKASLLVTMPDDDIHTFLRENLLLTLEVQDLEVRDKINDLLTLYLGFPDGQANFAKELLRVIEKNDEYLGTVWLKLKGREHPERPVVANWLIDYNQFSVSLSKPGLGITKRGGTERATYATQSENVRQLTADEKAILLRLLELYDWLRFEVAGEQASSAPQGFSYMSKERVVFPSPPRAPAPKATKLETGISNIEYGGKPSGIPDTKYQIQDTRKRVIPTPPRPPKRESGMSYMEYGRKPSDIPNTKYEIPDTEKERAKIEISEELYSKVREEEAKREPTSINEAIIHAREKALPLQDSKTEEESKSTPSSSPPSHGGEREGGKAEPLADPELEEKFKAWEEGQNNKTT